MDLTSMFAGMAIGFAFVGLAYFRGKATGRREADRGRMSGRETGRE
ncbi:hypothetical protein [Oceaniglobus trochenteri]|nr:hypothetical protein [Oceaniglobus trochenteri]